MFRLNTRSRSPWSPLALLGILCIALVLFTGVIQVTHSHPAGQPDHADCSLCCTAHHVVQVVALVSLELAVQPVAPVAIEHPVDLPRARVLVKLANRPPPATPAFA
jgi:hypothetical protein